MLACHCRQNIRSNADANPLAKHWQIANADADADGIFSLKQLPSDRLTNGLTNGLTNQPTEQQTDQLTGKLTDLLTD